MFTSSDLWNALAECFIPALGRDVVAAGLVRSASLDLDPHAPGSGIPGVPPRFRARIALTAPAAEDAINAQIRAAVENRLLGLPSISAVDLDLYPAPFAIFTIR